MDIMYNLLFNLGCTLNFGFLLANPVFGQLPKEKQGNAHCKKSLPIFKSPICG